MPKPTCVEDLPDGRPCGRPKSKRSTKWCSWHWLLHQPVSVRDENARRRANELKQDPASVRPDDVVCRVCAWYVPAFFMGRGRRCVGCEGRAQHENYVVRTYDLLRGDRDALFALQRGRCAVCRKEQIIKRLAVDHDHETNAVRGLLCQWCNEQVLGSLGGDTAKALPLARALVYYLETHPATGRWVPPEDQAEFGFPEREKPRPKSLRERVLGPDPLNEADKKLAPF